MKITKIILYTVIFCFLIGLVNTVSATDNTTLEDSTIIEYSENQIELESAENTIIVNGSAYNQMDNPTIQTAIDSAKDGDTILITGTEYVHCHFVINKKLNITSENGTKMSPCPSNTKGSGGIGIFYIGENGSGTIISGFTLTNDIGTKYKVNPYAIYVNNADNVLISDCHINEVVSGAGINLNNTLNTIINNCTVKSSTNGIYVSNSENLTITTSEIYNNKVSGIYIDENVENSLIKENNIHNNNDKGIYYGSCMGANILNNQIIENMNDVYQRATSGYGIYVNTTSINSMVIKGNYFYENGYYGVYNYEVTPKDQNAQIIDNNYFVGHIERAVYTLANGGSGVVYIWSNYYSNEGFCPSTYYEVGVKATNHERDLIIDNITQVKKGIYSVSFIRKDTKEIASALNSVNLTFYLNKQSTYPIPEENDTYQNITITNGTCIVNFRDATYLKTGNNLTAVGPGFGPIKYDGTSSRPVSFYIINDSEIPTGGNTTLTGNDLNFTYGEVKTYEAVLKNHEGNPISGETILITINGVTYNRTTNSSGVASLNIRLNSGKYNISAKFEGTDLYYESSTSNFITINSNLIETVLISENLTKTYKTSDQYKILLKDKDNNVIPDKNILITINGVTYTRITNSEGYAKLNINLNPGKYDTIVEFVNTTPYEYSVSLGYVIVNEIQKVTPELVTNDLNEYYGENKPFEAKLSFNNTVISSENITFTINGVDYNKQTDNNGIARLSIKLNPGTYTIKTTFKGSDNYYAKDTISNTVIVEKSTTGISSNLIANDFEEGYNQNKSFIVKLINNEGNPLTYQNVELTVNGVTYTKTTDYEGIARLTIRLNPGTYTITSEYKGNSYYTPAESITNEIIVLSSVIIPVGATNTEIQKTLDSITTKTLVVFDGYEYNNISINVNKPMIITSNKNTKLNGALNSAVITINTNDCSVNGLNIVANNSTGIILNNENTNINSNTITNTIDSTKEKEYLNGTITLPGNGIYILSNNNKIENNNISYFTNGISLKNAKTNTISNNTIFKNNYGITLEKNVENTLIFKNNISNNIGLITMEVVEGPLGYGIYLKDSGRNVNILNNIIKDNYLGIYIDSKNSTGIVIKNNLITTSVCEGISFNVNYNFSEDAIQPIVENNAIYNNAKGPSLIILGEISANPNGIYGPGEWNDTLKLKIGANWYGTNTYTQWGNGTVGPGTICPRINTTLITFNLTCITPGTYEAIFYNNNTIASDLPDFEYYFTLNFLTEKEQEVKANITEGKTLINFEKQNYFDTNNTIEGSSGSLKDSERVFRVTFTYKIPDYEIPETETYVSNNGSDTSGNGSVNNPYQTIKKAIEKTKDNGIIILNSDYFTGENNRNLEIYKNLTIQSNNTTLDAEAKSRHFIMKSDSKLKLIGLNLINGYDISNDGTYSGGSILSTYKNSEITLINCTIKNSTSRNKGGGIYSSGLLNIINTEFINNSATNVGGGLSSTGTLNIENSTFKYNKVPGIDTFTLAGGGISSSGKGTIKNSIFIGNHAGASGAISNSGKMIVDNCTIINNSARYCTGAIANNGGILLVNNSYIGYNYAKFYAAGILAPNKSIKVEIYNTIIEYNHAGWFASAINSYGDTVTIENCAIYNNSCGKTEGTIRSDDYLDALNNWWGQNTISSDYRNTQSDGYINVTKYLIFSFTSSNNLTIGKESTLTVDLKHYYNNETKKIEELNTTLNLPLDVKIYSNLGEIATVKLVNGTANIQYTPKTGVTELIATLHNQTIKLKL